MLNIYTSSVNQGRSFVLVNKALEENDKAHLFITLELNESEITKRMRVLNTVKYNHNIEYVNCAVKSFPSNVNIDEVLDFILKEEDKYDSILIDQSYLVQTDNQKENDSYSDNIRTVTNKYKKLSENIQKDISITFNLGRSYLNTDSFEKFTEARLAIIKGTNNIDTFVKGDFNIVHIFKKENKVFKLEYPYKKSEEVVDLTDYSRGYKNYNIEDVFG
jgi:predicted HNH restriction endonuclease